MDQANQLLHYQMPTSQREIQRLPLRLTNPTISWMALRRFSLISQRQVAQVSPFMPTLIENSDKEREQ